LRLLLATHGNANFLTELRDHWRRHSDVEVQLLDLAVDPEGAALTAPGYVERVAAAALGGAGPWPDRVERFWRGHLDRADAVFVDWCAAAAALVTLVDPGRTRVIVRAHSYELLGLWPHLVGFGRVDDVVFVSDPVRALAAATVPALRGPHPPRTWVVPNVMNLHRFAAPKPDAARFTVAVVGVGAVAKDPLWAVEVLRRLRAHDERYRLLLVGRGLDPATSPAARRYRARLRAALGPLEAAGVVRRTGHTRDVPRLLTGVGVVLSSSVRESFHCALVEGAASGAVPVVRDWPFLARYAGGARALFPPDWVVATPAEAVERILAATATPRSWRTAGAAAAAHALSTWDWSVTVPAFDELLFAPRPVTGA
jgi:glycosyltransferase involved in cell wall biosynthesis